MIGKSHQQPLGWACLDKDSKMSSFIHSLSDDDNSTWPALLMTKEVVANCSAGYHVMTTSL
jgi:hypothetical protein